MSTFKLKLIRNEDEKEVEFVRIPEEEKDTRLKDVVFFVEANSYEQLQLWSEYHEEVKWEQDLSGVFHTVGYIEGYERPVNVTFSFSKLNGKMICFYDAVSRYVDYDMIEYFIKSNYPVRWDKQTRWAMTDAMNFHHCVDYCKNEN